MKRACLPSSGFARVRQSPCVSRTPSRCRRAVSMAAAACSEQAIKLVERWLELDKDPGSREEVQQWLAAGDEATILEKLGKRLEFGTAGLRGAMGPGYNAMNAVVVQQTTQGLCSYMQQTGVEKLEERGVVIGYDGRYHSADFAQVAAAVFLSQGIKVFLFNGCMPTPFVAAGVAELKAAAGIMVTASHNPMQDNGYKVYWGNGCQIIPPHDENIAASILSHLDLWELPSLPHPLLSDPAPRVMFPYYARIASKLITRSPQDNKEAARVVYTPLHGVGAKALSTAFSVVGLPLPHLVEAQAEPDPEFPTVIFPNPEEGAGTWALAFAEGRAQGSQLVIANDPDADRLAAAEADNTAPGGYRPFTGNEIGALLAHWLWTNHQRSNPTVPPSSCAMLASVVSSSFIGAMAAKEGFIFEQTLTGFKWLGNRALELEAQGIKVLFAFEEAIGFMPGAAYRDKDGIMAAVSFCEMAAELYRQGTTLHKHLAKLYTMYGTPALRSGYFIADQPAKSKAVFDRLRQDGKYPQALGGHTVQWVRDLGVGLDTRQPDRQATLPWRAGDMMISLGVEGGATLTLRASGTEPKLKWYLEVLGDDVTATSALADQLVVAVDQELIRVDAAGLTRPRPAA